MIYIISGERFGGVKGRYKLSARACGIILKGINNRDLILLRSYDSLFTTILEGNKTAVALYIKYCIEKELFFESFRVYLGQLERKSIWQW